MGKISDGSNIPMFSLGGNTNKPIRSAIHELKNNKVDWKLNPQTGLPIDHRKEKGRSEFHGTFKSNGKIQQLEVVIVSRDSQVKQHQSDKNLYTQINYPAISNNPDDPNHIIVSVNEGTAAQVDAYALTPDGRKAILQSFNANKDVKDVPQNEASWLLYNAMWLQTYDNNPAPSVAKQRQQQRGLR
jgi:hypothetical protein